MWMWWRGAFFAGCPALQAAQAEPYPLEYDLLEQAILKGYTTPVFAEETAAVQAWIGTLPNPGGFPSAEAFVLHLAETIHQKIRYERREQKGVQRPVTGKYFGPSGAFLKMVVGVEFSTPEG